MITIPNIYYLCDTLNKGILTCGELPETWNNITGMTESSIADLKDLEWTGNPGMGFLTEMEALQAGIPSDVVSSAKAVYGEFLWTLINAEVNNLMYSIRWRIDRFNDQTQSGGVMSETTIQPVLNYVQALRDIATQQTDPFNIVWPVVPPLP
jgi:hypothetical protein